MLAAAKLARDRGATLHVLVVGSGEQEAAAKQFVHDHALPVTFAGFLNQGEIATAYAAADVLVLPSDWGETWGLVVNEAMACGLPAILSNACGCAPESLHRGRTGFLFDPASERELERLLHLCSTMPDFEWRTMGAAAQAVINGYSPEKWADPKLPVRDGLAITLKR